MPTLTEERDECECEEECECICAYCRCSNPTEGIIESTLSDTIGTMFEHGQCCTE